MLGLDRCKTVLGYARDWQRVSTIAASGRLLAVSSRSHMAPICQLMSTDLCQIILKVTGRVMSNISGRPVLSCTGRSIPAKSLKLRSILADHKLINWDSPGRQLLLLGGNVVSILNKPIRTDYLVKLKIVCPLNAVTQTDDNHRHTPFAEVVTLSCLLPRRPVLASTYGAQRK